MDILHKVKSFESYSEAQDFAYNLLTFEKLVEIYRDLSIAEKQQCKIYKVEVRGRYDTILFVGYEIKK